MLILSREVGEIITIGDDIKITVLHIGVKSIKLGIDAPKEMPIRRDDIKREQPSINYPSHKGRGLLH